MVLKRTLVKFDVSTQHAALVFLLIAANSLANSPAHCLEQPRVGDASSSPPTGTVASTPTSDGGQLGDTTEEGNALAIAMSDAVARGLPTNALLVMRVSQPAVQQQEAALRSSWSGTGSDGAGISRAARLGVFAATKARVLGQAVAGNATETPSAAAAPGLSGPQVAGSYGQGQGLQLVRDFKQLPVMLITIGNLGVLSALRAHPDVVSVRPDYPNRLQTAESLPLVWQPAAAAWGYAGTNCSVAIIDTGLDYTQPDFGPCSAPGDPPPCRVAFAQDFSYMGDDGTLDEFGRPHGTNVAGVVAKAAPGARLLSLDVFTGLEARTSDVISAIDWVISNKEKYGICAMTLSLGDDKKRTGHCDSEPDAIAISEARSAGVIAATAAGNLGFRNGLIRPACASAAVSVGAVYDANLLSPRVLQGVCKDASPAADRVTCYSNSASYLTVLAPGDEITAGGASFFGTSQATPFVAAAAAVLMSSVPSAPVDDVVAALVAGGWPVRDARNGLVKPRVDFVAASSLISGGAFLEFRDAHGVRSYFTASQQVAVRVNTHAPLPPGVAACITDDVAATADTCCDLRPLGGTGTDPASGVNFAASNFTLSAPGDGERAVRAFVRISASCSAPLLASAWAPLTLDTLPPAGVGVAIGDGSGALSGRQAVLKFSYSDASGVTQMCIRASQSPKGLQRSCKWQPYRRAVVLNLRPFRGNHTVRVQLRDAVGNEAAAEASVLLEGRKGRAGGLGRRRRR